MNSERDLEVGVFYTKSLTIVKVLCKPGIVAIRCKTSATEQER